MQCCSFGLRVPMRDHDAVLQASAASLPLSTACTYLYAMGEEDTREVAAESARLSLVKRTGGVTKALEPNARHRASVKQTRVLLHALGDMLLSVSRQPGVGSRSYWRDIPSGRSSRRMKVFESTTRASPPPLSS